MKLFKNVDERFRELGFYKMKNEDKEDKYGVSYIKEIRLNDNNKYNHRLDIIHKANGNHLIQSYQEDVNSDGFNNMVGLNYKTTKLAMKKYRQLKRKYKW